jgi:hypothetical protein
MRHVSRAARAVLVPLCLAASPAAAALGDHEWSKAWSVNGVSSAVDGNGGVSTAGTVNGAVDLGGGLLPGGGGDVFVAKYASDGSHVWSGVYDATSFPTVTAVACAPAGDTYVAGVLSKGGTIDFGGGPIGGNFGDMWAVHFDPAGGHVWSDTFGRGVINDVDAGDAHAVFAAQSIGVANFGGGDLNTSGDRQSIVAMLAPDGSHEWSAAFGDAAVQAGLEVGIAANGDVVLLSSVLGTADFGGGGLTADATPDLALAKFDVGGAHAWSQLHAGQFGAFSTILNTGMDVNTSGSIVITGEFTGSLTFGGATFVSNGLDVFLARFDGAGLHDLSDSFGGAGDQSGMGAWFDPSFNLVLAGTFAGDLDFGGGALSNAGSRDAYVASLDGTGTHRYSRSFGSSGFESRCNVEAGPDGGAIFNVVGPTGLDLGGGALTGSFYLGKLEGADGGTTATPVAAGRSDLSLTVCPNPSVSDATIRFATPSAGVGPARILVFDAAGRAVRTLPSPGAGAHAVTWDGRSASGAAVVPGVYFVRVESGGITQTKRLVRVR